MEELDLKRRINIRDASAGLPIMQTFSLHILHHVATYHMVYDRNDQAKNRPAKLWTPCWRTRLDSFDYRSLLARDRDACFFKYSA